MIKSGVQSFPRPKFAPPGGGGGGGPASTYLLHFDGTNGSTTFTDVHGHTFASTTGAPALSTTQAKFGPSSLGLNGSSAINSSTSLIDCAFAAGDVTVDAWVFLTSVPAVAQIAGCWNSSSMWQVLITNNHLGLGINGTNYNSSAITVNANTWYHVAWTRASGSNQLFFNGVSVLTQVDATGINTQQQLSIGRNDQSGGTWYITGFIDELRIIKGTAAWTSNFTPPTSAYTN